MYSMYGFGKQKATLSWDKCLTTFRALEQQNLSRIILNGNRRRMEIRDPGGTLWVSIDK